MLSCVSSSSTLLALGARYAILLSQVGAFGSTSDKIKNSFVVREHFELAVKLSPADATARHLLGLWCFEVQRARAHTRAPPCDSAPRPSHGSLDTRFPGRVAVSLPIWAVLATSSLRSRRRSPSSRGLSRRPPPPSLPRHPRPLSTRRLATCSQPRRPSRASTPKTSCSSRRRTRRRAGRLRPKRGLTDALRRPQRRRRIRRRSKRPPS